MSRNLLARAIGLALVVVPAAAAPAHAAPTWLDEAAPFGEVPARQTDARAAMAPDGTIVFARYAPDGALEVRERPPGGPVGPTITLPPVAVDPQPLPNLQVLVGADGTAAVLFDVGNLRYASLRVPGGTWTDPDVAGLSGAGPRRAAISPGGVLWIMGRAPENADRLVVFRTAPGDPARVTELPAPPPGARQLAGTLTAPHGGGARVLFVEETVTANGEDCSRTTAMVEVDVPDWGPAGAPTVLDRLTGTGTGTADACALAAGAVLRDPLLATDGTDSDTAVYTVLSASPFEVTVRARHRPSGQAWPAREWPAEVVGGADLIAEQVLGGSGAPLVVMRGLGDKSVSARRPDGVWTAPAVVVGIEGARSLDVARTGRGTTVFAWIQGGNNARRFGRVVDADGRPGPRETLAEAGPADTLLAVGADFSGNAVALYSRGVGNGLQLRMNGYDAAGPRLTTFSIPPVTSAGAAVRFSVSGLDVWSGPLRTATWDFGDGAGANGLDVDHTYTSGGQRTVNLRAADDSGNTTTMSQTVTVAGAPGPVGDPPVATPTPSPTPTPTPAPVPAPAPASAPPTVLPPAPDARAPVVRGVSINPGRPRAGRAPALALTTDEAGTLDLTLARTAPGVRSGSRCVARSRGRGAKRCTRTLARVDGTHALAAGTQRVTLPRLAAGTWTVTAIVTDAAGNRSASSRLTVRVA